MSMTSNPVVCRELFIVIVVSCERMTSSSSSPLSSGYPIVRGRRSCDQVFVSGSTGDDDHAEQQRHARQQQLQELGDEEDDDEMLLEDDVASIMTEETTATSCNSNCSTVASELLPSTEEINALLQFAPSTAAVVPPPPPTNYMNSKRRLCDDDDVVVNNLTGAANVGDVLTTKRTTSTTATKTTWNNAVPIITPYSRISYGAYSSSSFHTSPNQSDDTNTPFEQQQQVQDVKSSSLLLLLFHPEKNEKEDEDENESPCCFYVLCDTIQSSSWLDRCRHLCLEQQQRRPQQPQPRIFIESSSTTTSSRITTSCPRTTTPSTPTKQKKKNKTRQRVILIESLLPTTASSTVTSSTTPSFQNIDSSLLMYYMPQICYPIYGTSTTPSPWLFSLHLDDPPAENPHYGRKHDTVSDIDIAATTTTTNRKRQRRAPPKQVLHQGDKAIHEFNINTKHKEEENMTKEEKKFSDDVNHHFPSSTASNIVGWVCLRTYNYVLARAMGIPILYPTTPQTKTTNAATMNCWDGSWEEDGQHQQQEYQHQYDELVYRRQQWHASATSTGASNDEAAAFELSTNVWGDHVLYHQVQSILAANAIPDATIKTNKAYDMSNTINNELPPTNSTENASTNATTRTTSSSKTTSRYSWLETAEWWPQPQKSLLHAPSCRETLAATASLPSFLDNDGDLQPSSNLLSISSASAAAGPATTESRQGRLLFQDFSILLINDDDDINKKKKHKQPMTKTTTRTMADDDAPDDHDDIIKYNNPNLCLTSPNMLHTMSTDQIACLSQCTGATVTMKDGSLLLELWFGSSSSVEKRETNNQPCCQDETPSSRCGILLLNHLNHSDELWLQDLKTICSDDASTSTNGRRMTFLPWLDEDDDYNDELTDHLFYLLQNPPQQQQQQQQPARCENEVVVAIVRYTWLVDSICANAIAPIRSYCIGLILPSISSTTTTTL